MSTEKLLFLDSFYPPRAGNAPVKVEIRFFPDDVDRSRPIPRWPFAIEITLSDFRGIAQACGGTVEAADEQDAKARVYIKTIEVLAELLAARVAKESP